MTPPDRTRKSLGLTTSCTDFDADTAPQPTAQEADRASIGDVAEKKFGEWIYDSEHTTYATPRDQRRADYFAGYSDGHTDGTKRGRADTLAEIKKNG